MTLIREIIKMGNLMDTEYINGIMELFIKDNFAMDYVMDVVNGILRNKHTRGIIKMIKNQEKGKS